MNSTSAAARGLQQLRFSLTFADKIPRSFLQLLSIYNGVSCFDYVDVDLFSIEYLTRHFVELEEEWVDAVKFQANEIFVFGRSDFDSVAVAFLIQHRKNDGEMPVVWFDARGVLADYPSLEDYLRSRREWFQEMITLERRDGPAERCLRTSPGKRPASARWDSICISDIVKR